MGPGSVAETFYAGRYGEVLARTIDAPACEYDDEEVAYVVGALAFVGRTEEARAVLASQMRRGNPETIEHLRARVASRFFVGVATSRAGRHDKAERDFRDNLRIAGASRDPICRFYVAQGLACLRYFRGMMRLAARHVRRSLFHAIEARFQYGRLLATDLRGHALVQIGCVRAGLALLEQARELSRSLGLSGNAGAIACAVATYRARFGAVPLGRAIDELTALARSTPAEDSYSRRAVETELAQQLALAGRGEEAWARLEALSAAPTADGDARARVRLLLACAFVARLRYGLDSARTYALEARAALGAEGDLALAADLLCAELGLASPEERPALLRRLAHLHAATGISRAEVYATVFGEGGEAPDLPAALRVSDLEEDRAGARLAGVWNQGRASVEGLLRDGHLGLIPLASGVAEEAAIVEVSAERLVVAERGNVRLVDGVPAGPARLLREIAAGAGSGRAFLDKERLVLAVWGLPRYRPDRHDAIVHTAVSRLRALLGTAGHWIESRDGAYRLASHVAYRGLGAPAEPAMPRDEAGSIESEPRETASEGSREQALLAHLCRARSCSTAEATSVLGVSEMTAFRALRGLCERGLVSRTGKGRSTRYTLIDGREERG
jgi:hypothetical protein